MASSELHSRVLLLFHFMLTLSSVVHPLIVPLTRRDSPDSPFYDPKATLADRWRSVHRRSVAPLRSGAAVNAGRYDIGGEYHMSIKMGRVVLTGWIDVAGRLISTPCWDNGHGMIHYEFSVDNQVGCDSSYCSLMNSLCTGRNSTGGETCGFFVDSNAPESLAILVHDLCEIPHNGSAVPASADLSFGCIELDSMAPTTVGIMGSGMVLLQQLTHDVNVTRFAHCFARGESNSSAVSSSHMRFGDDVALTGLVMPLTMCSGVSARSNGATFSPPPLVDVAVHAQALRLTHRDLGDTARCNVALDSTRPLTLMPRSAFNKVAASVEGFSKLRRSHAESGEPWSLCFQGTEKDIAGRLPAVTLYLGASCRLVLPKRNTYAQVDDNRVCMLMAPTDGERTTIGTLAMQDMNVAYDLDNMKIAIDLRSCSY